MPPVLLGARALARRLDVSYETVLGWSRRGLIPSLRDGRNRLLFNLDSVLMALQCFNVLPVTPPRPEAPAVAPLAELPLTWCLSAVAKNLGISRHTLEREIAAGRFPPPDLTIGRTPLWRVETIRRWVEGGGR